MCNNSENLFEIPVFQCEKQVEPEKPDLQAEKQVLLVKHVFQIEKLAFRSKNWFFD